MALIFEVASSGGSEWAAGDWTDISDVVKTWEGLRVGHSAHQGEVGTGSGFDLYSTSGISLPVKRLFRARETATSPDTMLMRGRIAEVGVGPWPVAERRHFDVQIDDANIELFGIPIRKWVRPRETDYQRLVALWRAYLKGDDSSANYHRPSTRLVITRDGDPRWARNANRVTLPKQTYTDTDPAGILRDIAEAAGKEFFVTNRMELFYDLPTSTKFAAGLSITDVDPDGETSFAAEIDARGERDGSEFLSGVIVPFGKNKRIARYRPAVEAAHDFWREVVPIDSTSADDARKRATATLQGQAREDVTVSCSIVLRDDQVDLVRAGQTLSFRDAAAGVTSPTVLRVGRLMWEPLKVGLYRAHLELGFPKKLAPRVSRGLGKNPGNRTASSGPEVTPGGDYQTDPDQPISLTGDADYGFAGSYDHIQDIDAAGQAGNRAFLVLRTSSAVMPDTPAGWTEVDDLFIVEPGPNTSWQAWTRVLDGTETEVSIPILADAGEGMTIASSYSQLFICRGVADFTVRGFAGTGDVTWPWAGPAVGLHFWDTAHEWSPPILTTSFYSSSDTMPSSPYTPTEDGLFIALETTPVGSISPGEAGQVYGIVEAAAT